MILGLAVLSGVLLLLNGDRRAKANNIVQMSSKDAVMNLAVSRSQETLPNFIAQLGHLDPDEEALVKCRAHEGDKVEHVWVEQPVYSNGTFSGKLSKDTYELPSLKPGMWLTFPQSDVSDWVILRKDGTKQGGFTIDAIEALK